MEFDRRSFISATGATVASLTLAGCMGGGPRDQESDPAEGSGGNETTTGGNETGNGDSDLTDLDGELGETPQFLKIASFEAYETVEDVGVFGTVKNVGDNPIDDLEVEVTLNDGDTVIGEFVDTADAERDYLPTGKQWRFNVVFEDENLSQATGFTVSADGDIVENSAFGNNTSDAFGNDTGTENETTT